MRIRTHLIVVLTGALLGAPLAAAGPAAADDALANWFDDPFFRISSAVPDCPMPAGPFVTESDRRAQTHRRAEKGTTCWLAGECDRPSAYAYDGDIATAFQAAMRERRPFSDTSLWVTIQGRVVYIEGCVARESQAAELEAFARALPHVQQAIAIVRSDPSAPPPYRPRVAVTPAPR
jgi:hypothetical protein